MSLKRSIILFAFVVVVALAQNPIATDSPYQVRYASNLNLGESQINITNTGASASTTGFPAGPEGPNLCVNVYTFSPDEQLVACCSCVVSPNALVNLGVNRDLIINTLTPAHPTSVVVKLLATSGTGTCNPATAGTGSSVPTTGLSAWGTTLHVISQPGQNLSVAMTETRFTPATLSGIELARMTALCGFIQANGSGFGICNSCRNGGLGTAAQ